MTGSKHISKPIACYHRKKATPVVDDGEADEISRPTESGEQTSVPSKKDVMEALDVDWKEYDKLLVSYLGGLKILLIN